MDLGKYGNDVKCDYKGLIYGYWSSNVTIDMILLGVLHKNM